MMPGRFKKVHGVLQAPPCRNCHTNVHRAPFCIQARSVNNARMIEEWKFCSPSCLTDWVKQAFLPFENTDPNEPSRQSEWWETVLEFEPDSGRKFSEQ